MSEYELNFLQKKYELYQAQIALEEAQNAKSQVRMTRDANGNMSYTYTADQEAIDKAEQGYNDALYNLMNLNQEQLWNYGQGKTLYAWYIDGLKIYDKPKELSEFNVKRAIQSWCYVEELEDE